MFILSIFDYNSLCFLFFYISTFVAHPEKVCLIRFSRLDHRKVIFYSFSGWILQRISFIFLHFNHFSPQAKWTHLGLGLIPRFTRRMFNLFSFCGLQAVFLIFLYLLYFLIFLCAPRKCIFYLFYGWTPGKGHFIYFKLRNSQRIFLTVLTFLIFPRPKSIYLFMLIPPCCRSSNC